MIDTHAHLNDPAFASDLPDAIRRAREANVRVILDVSEDLDSARRSVRLFENEEGIWSAVGFHPHRARALSEDELVQFKALLKCPKVIALGEIGLDYFYEKASRDAQKGLFAQMLDLALEAGLPVAVHNRDSDEDLIALLSTRASRGLAGLIHCFTSGWETARRVLDFGFFISFSGIVTFKNALRLPEVVRQMPLDRILVETDAPYLAPEPMRGKRNEPAFVRHTAQRIAEIKNISLDEFDKILDDNVRKLFAKKLKIRNQDANDEQK